MHAQSCCIQGQSDCMHAWGCCMHGQSCCMHGQGCQTWMLNIYADKVLPTLGMLKFLNDSSYFSLKFENLTYDGQKS